MPDISETISRNGYVSINPCQLGPLDWLVCGGRERKVLVPVP